MFPGSCTVERIPESILAFAIRVPDVRTCKCMNNRGVSVTCIAPRPALHEGTDRMRADEVSSARIVTLWGRRNHRLFLVPFTSRAIDHSTKFKGKVECIFASGKPKRTLAHIE